MSEDKLFNKIKQTGDLEEHYKLLKKYKNKLNKEEIKKCKHPSLVFIYANSGRNVYKCSICKKIIKGE